MTPWVIFGWFMLGVIARQLYKFLGWVATAKDKRTVTLTQCIAMKAQGVIAGAAVAWIWVGGHLWAWLDSLDLGELGTFIDKVPQAGADALSSIGVGFLIEWLLVERLVDRFGVHRKAG